MSTWIVDFTTDAIRLFNKVVLKKDRKRLIDLIGKHLYANPDKPSKTLKELSSDKPPYFHGKVVWEIKDKNYRIIYEIRYETKEIIIFFVGKKENKTTSEMMEG